MAERCHTTHTLRLLPDLGGQLLRSTFELVLTTIGIAWLDSASAPLAEWARAGLGLQRVVVSVEGVQSLVGFALAVWLLLGYLTRVGEGGGMLLLVYWALNLPVLGQEVALMARQ